MYMYVSIDITKTSWFHCVSIINVTLYEHNEVFSLMDPIYTSCRCKCTYVCEKNQVCNAKRKMQTLDRLLALISRVQHNLSLAPLGLSSPWEH